MSMTAKDLIDFEERIRLLYEQGKIHAPIHLSGGNETALIRIFKEYREGDWIFSTWRNHYHWLLSGRSPDELERQILDGNSMGVCGDRFFTSAIVGGISPIALGVALSIKLRNGTERVWCFIGDMGWLCGITQECFRYACGHDLPITFVVEDNGLSVTTDTKKVWGNEYFKEEKNYIKYTYERKFPHAGIGKHILF